MKLANLILCLFLFSCSRDVSDDYKKKLPSYRNGYKIIEIDSCEYIETHVHNGEVLTHKGNCKFCAERMEKEKTK